MIPQHERLRLVHSLVLKALVEAEADLGTAAADGSDIDDTDAVDETDAWPFSPTAEPTGRDPLEDRMGWELTTADDNLSSRDREELSSGRFPCPA